MSDSDDTDDSDGTEFETELAAALESEFGADADRAAEAAAGAAAFRDDWDEDLTVDAVVAAIEDAGDHYDDFANRYDLAIGDLAHEHEDCTDSREYRLAGFGHLAADPEQGH